MSESQVIARKFRPKTFEQVVGQEAITRTLHNAISSDRLHHAYLFTGARGVGKTTTARIFARALNCIKGITTEPCGVCDSCVEIAQSRSIDVLEIDAASNTGVDNVREVIINGIQIAPARDHYKIFIIDEVHQLSGPAFNALLKTLEEPPAHVVFIMATTELHKVPETILSRCQVFEFRTISPRKIFGELRRIADAMQVEISDAALLSVARAGEGSMRDAESALDQVISFAGSKVADEDVSAALGLVDTETLNTVVRAIGEQNSGQVLRIVDEVVSRGYDLRNFCRELMSHLRALLVVKVAGFDAELAQMPQGEGETLARLADLFSEQDLVRFFSILTRTEQDIRVSSEPRFQLEMGLMRLVQARRLYLLEDALSQIAEIQSRLTGQGATRTVMPPLSLPAPVASRPIPRVAEAPRSMKEPDAPPAPPKSELPAAKEAARAYKAAPPPLMGEPPPYDDEPVDAAPPSDGGSATPGRAYADDAHAAEKIREKVQARNKMFLLSSLDQADSITVDGDYLRISFAPANATFKGQVESKQNRALLEEIGREVTGRKLTVSVSVGAQPPAPVEKPQKKREKKADKAQAQANPAVRALVDKFHGEIIEVVEPE